MKNKKKSKSVVLLLLLLILGISIGYAALTTTLNINGNTTIEKASWDIHFENLVKITGSEVATTEASIDDTKTLIEYTVTLPKPGDFYEFTVDIVNAGTIDAMISEVLKEGLTTDQEKYISYTATYSDGIALEEKDFLKSGETQNIRVRVKYRDDISASELPTEETALSLRFKVTYIQADESAKERTVAICKRATELHTAECTQMDTTNYCSGAGYTTNGSKGTTIIKYGNLGTIGALPASGDAFDCDVNGDGDYDSETERFYYITELDSNNNYGVLIYYNNINNGLPSNTSIVSYNISDTSSLSGPQTIMTHLPSASKWNKVSLFNTKRDIKDENGNIIINEFNYEGYTSRFLTTQEIEKACGFATANLSSDKILYACDYLLENTNYSSADIISEGYWVESLFSGYTGLAWYVNTLSSSVRYTSKDHSKQYGPRPVIEVPISNILY